ncbi:plasmid mobilization protein [Trinickia symbiotica]|uniref:Uncharacterized protein n=1 Tax=Trinickia symbiotica TaxID=863227 RepID=A0A2N7WZE8_9BURK|nr:ribbon-helix-helix protein, CopG family [Trinickia symbiotica]PMS34863.1 hypothetical protein C0Z20_20925 [Trinickia symbiotica]
MKNSSERLVVFVTPAQKHAITARARELGVSVSELLRRALLAYDGTAEQVRAARIVGNWRTGQSVDALNETLRQLAQVTAAARPAAPAAPAVPTPAPGLVSPPAVEAEEREQPVSVAAAVAQALELRGEDADAPSEDRSLDAQTVARMAARWMAGTRDADHAAEIDAAALPMARQAWSGT